MRHLKIPASKKKTLDLTIPGFRPIVGLGDGLIGGAADCTVRC
jgi:hypothetical protein